MATPLTVPTLHHHPHAISDKVVEKLKNSRFFTISLLIHMVLIAFLGSMVLFRAIQEEDDFTAGGGGGGFVSGEEEAAGPQDQQPVTPQDELVPQPPTIQTPTSSMDVITALTPTMSNFSMTVAPPVVTAPTDVASKLPVASKGGTNGPSGLPSGLPGVLAGRAAGAPRDKARRDSGGKDKSEEAVMKGLRWLKANQNADGTWGTATKGAMTGLGLLCFLGHGETYFSVEFGETVKKAVDALVKEGTAQAGRLAYTGNTLANQNAPYQHAIGVYALSEAYTLTKDDRIPPVLTKAVAYIINGQGADGGWMYKYDRSQPSDTSVGGWQIQALKAAHLTELPIPGITETLDKGMLNLERVFDKKNGTFGYRNNSGKISLTGVGALNILMWKGQKSGMVREAVDAILDKTKSVDYQGEEADLYAWYYHTQACLMYGGSSWTKWNRLFQDAIADAQSPDGSWPVQMKTKNNHGPVKEAAVTGQVYRTTLCVLMLEVFYRYLPSTKS